MAVASKRSRQVKQPRGGYINPKAFEVVQRGKGDQTLPLAEENVHASIVGMAVDCLTRAALGAPVQEAFDGSLRGALNLGELTEAAERLACVKQLDEESIFNACQLVGYEVAYRNGGVGYKPVADIQADTSTCWQIAQMVDRSLSFLEECGGVAEIGSTFGSAYTETVTAGEIDYLTADTLWDVKVSVTEPKKEHTLQLLMYWLMGQEEGRDVFQNVTHLGVFNPRLNRVYRLTVADVPAEVQEAVRRDVIGYS